MTNPATQQTTEQTTEERSRVLAAHLEPTPRNLHSAAAALARVAELGWEPLSGYPGSDTHWYLRCLLCGWEGQRFYSHIRRNKPKFRHSGCIPLSEQAAKLAEVTKRLTPACNCVFHHPTTPEEAGKLLEAIAYARSINDANGLMIHLVRLLGPCPAAAARSHALQTIKSQN